MHPNLFRKLLELKALNSDTTVEAIYDSYDEEGSSKRIKGTYKVINIFTDPFRFTPALQVQGPTDVLVIEYQDIKKVNGEDLATFAKKYELRVDGASVEAPKRRGRKPKAKPVVEDQYDIEDEYDEDYDEEETLSDE